MEKVSAFKDAPSENNAESFTAQVPEPTSATKTKPKNKINRMSLNLPKKDNYGSKTNVLNMSTPRA